MLLTCRRHMLIGAADLLIMLLILEGEEALFDEEFTEEEVLGELAPLTVLLAFLLIKSNRCATEEKSSPSSFCGGTFHACLDSYFMPGKHYSNMMPASENLSS
jgi:hypothetical protein